MQTKRDQPVHTHVCKCGMLVYCGLDERLTGTGATEGLVSGGGDDVTELEGVGGLQQVTGGGRGQSSG